MYSKEDIKKQLSAMKLPKGSTVLVHSALSKVGEVEGRGDGLIDALKEYVCENGGLLCIPTHTWANLGRSDVITLDLAEPSTCIGTLPNLAAKRTDACRSVHPTHSMAVFGDGAKEFASGEELFDSPADPRGCYGKIYEKGGYILLVGVGHNRNTYLHCVEEMLGVENRLDKNIRRVTVRCADGIIEERFTRGHFTEGVRDISTGFPKYEPAFRYHGCITDGYVGNAPTQLCSARKMAAVMKLIYQKSGGAELLISQDPIPKEYYEGELCEDVNG